jgi:hypothetical protein
MKAHIFYSRLDRRWIIEKEAFVASAVTWKALWEHLRRLCERDEKFKSFILSKPEEHHGN